MSDKEFSMYTRLACLPLALICAVLPSCGVFQSQTDGPAAVEELIARIQNVQVEVGLVQRDVKAAMERMRFLAAGQSEDSARRAFEAFQAAAAEARTQVAKLQVSVEPMQQAAEPVFSRWEARLAAFHNPTTRRRSQARLDDARARYHAIARTLPPAQAACDRFNEILQGHESLLATGLTDEVITGIRGDVQQLADLESEIQRHLGRCLVAAQEYVDRAGMPGQGTQLAAPPAANPPAPR
jgi:hypothetical protein